MSTVLSELAGKLVLGSLLDAIAQRLGGYDLVAHWTQGEFHHDLVLRVAAPGDLPGPVLVVATNCNGGVKELLCFADMPSREGLWRTRCPTIREFAGPPVEVLAREVTLHWFDPCELLAPDARSELRPEHRERQAGGGWVPRERARAPDAGAGED
jgi:hypothetical protein